MYRQVTFVHSPIPHSSVSLIVGLDRGGTPQGRGESPIVYTLDPGNLHPNISHLS